MLTRVVVLALALGSIVGCVRSTENMMQPTPSRVLQIAPSDGATGVRLDTGVTLDFGVAVDRSAVENGFHLISEADMGGSCPDTSMGAHGTMDTIMNDPNMMAHMDAVHATRGRFTWNSAGTTCSFKPDSLMRPQTEYMMHMGSGMIAMMDKMGGAMGAGHMTSSGDMVAHFMTMTSDDHSGHHP